MELLVAKLFISYKRGTSSVNPLKERLEERGYATWYDKTDLHTGDDWKEKINQAVDAADAIVVGVTPQACNSEYVQHEVSRGLQRDKVILPLKLENFSSDDAFTEGIKQLGIADLNVSDLTLPDPDTWKRVLDEVVEKLRIVGLLPDVERYPSALSKIPHGLRSSIDIPLIGRDQDIDWLKQNSNNKILVGQPGSGKTFLLYKLVEDGFGLFLVDTDRSELLTAIQTRKPHAVIVDDALNKTENLQILLQIRRQTQSNFEIWVACWPGDLARIKNTLPRDAQTRTLHKLDRDQILDVVKYVGLLGPDALVREIIEQADGRPGLAVTLTEVCKQSGSATGIFTGVELRHSVETFFIPRSSREAVQVLATFSLGGDAGISLKNVATILDLNVSNVQNIVQTLAEGGIVIDREHGNLAVTPPALRESLVSEIFFKGAFSHPLDLSEVLELGTNPKDIIITLIGAKWRGATISSEQLQTLITAAASPVVLREYASIGKSEAIWVLRNYPNTFETLAEIYLHFLPEVVIPQFMEQSVGKFLSPHFDYPPRLKLIKEWALSGEPNTKVGVQRRSAILLAIRQWLAEGKDNYTALSLIPVVFSPKYEEAADVSGGGNKITLRFSYLSFNDLTEIGTWWADTFQNTKHVLLQQWNFLYDLLVQWAYVTPDPKPIAATISQMNGFAKRIVADLMSLAAERPGILHALNGISKHAELNVDVELDETFEALFPDDVETADEDEQLGKVRQLAKTWSTLPAIEALGKIAFMEAEANAASISWPRQTPYLCEQIINYISSPLEWAQHAMKMNLPEDLVFIFLVAASKKNELGWINFVADSFTNRCLRWQAVYFSLTNRHATAELIEIALQNSSEFSKQIERICLQGRVSESILEQLLDHNDDAVALATARGIWFSNSKGNVLDRLRDKWTKGILNWDGSNDGLTLSIFATDKKLRIRWIERRFKQDTFRYSHQYNRVLEFIGDFEAADRYELLQKMRMNSWATDVIPVLIGDDADLYESLLKIEALRDLHLDIFKFPVNDVWVERAKIALRIGYTASQISNIHHSVESFWSSDKKRDYWSKRRKQIEPLLSHEDQGIREVGKTALTVIDTHYHDISDDDDEK